MSKAAQLAKQTALHHLFRLAAQPGAADTPCRKSAKLGNKPALHSLFPGSAAAQHGAKRSARLASTHHAILSQDPDVQQTDLSSQAPALMMPLGLTMSERAQLLASGFGALGGGKCARAGAFGSVFLAPAPTPRCPDPQAPTSLLAAPHMPGTPLKRAGVAQSEPGSKVLQASAAAYAFTPTQTFSRDAVQLAAHPANQVPGWPSPQKEVPLFARCSRLLFPAMPQARHSAASLWPPSPAKLPSCALSQRVTGVEGPGKELANSAQSTTVRCCH
jgi:hypothetical protein